MSKIHHFKIKNKGKRGHIHDIGNINIRLNVGKQRSTESSHCSEEECRNCDRLDESHPQQLQQADEYEGGVSSESAEETETESESETDTDGQLTPIKENVFGNMLVYTGKLINSLTSTGKATKVRKVIKKKRSCKKHKFRNSLQNNVKEYFKIDKPKTDLTSILKNSSELTVYALGSYFGGYVQSSRGLNIEFNRFSTFHRYKGNGVIASLARDGFYHDHDVSPTATKCFGCGVSHDTWGPHDDVHSIHRQISPNCEFVRRSSSATDQEVAAMEAVSLRTDVTERQSGSVTRTGSAVNEAVQTINLAHARTQEGHREQQEGHREQQEGHREQQEGHREQQEGHREQQEGHREQQEGHWEQQEGHGEQQEGHWEQQEGHREQQEGHREQQEDHREQLTETRVAQDNNHQFVESLQRDARISTNEEVTVGAAAGTGQFNPAAGRGGRKDRTITVLVDNPKHPDYLNIDRRVNSYQGWPEYLDQTPRQMAEAGFFFVGVADFTRCFCCGGGLRNWDPGDDPIVEHTRWFPSCEYINKLKGERYVAAVQRRHEEHIAEQQRQQNELAQRHEESRNQSDPLTMPAALTLLEMGYSSERIHAAVTAVSQQTGQSVPSIELLLTYILDSEDTGSRTGLSTDTQAQHQAGASFQLSSGAVADACASPSTSNRQEMETLREENQRLKSMTLCKICMDNQIAIVFLPCSHMVCCDTCSTSIRRCPSCNVIVNARITPVT